MGLTLDHSTKFENSHVNKEWSFCLLQTLKSWLVKANKYSLLPNYHAYCSSSILKFL